MPLLPDTASDPGKASHCGAFLLFCGLLLFSLRAASQEGCGPPADVERVEVASVLDGDTLQLRDGRTIRLVGIDTPELGRDGRPDTPGAVEAKTALQSLAKQSNNQLYLRQGREEFDRHRRNLAHLYTHKGHNLTAKLLARGLGYQVALPPNLRHLACYRNAEARARDGSLGLWRQPIAKVSELTGKETGFHILRGEIVRVGRSKSALWLNLEEGPAIRITWDDWAGFPLSDPDLLLGRELEFRGWLYLRKGEQRVRIRHPSAIHGLW
jgi:endonuclease YncB( thermonuclease family)